MTLFHDMSSYVVNINERKNIINLIFEKLKIMKFKSLKLYMLGFQKKKKSHMSTKDK